MLVEKFLPKHSMVKACLPLWKVDTVACIDISVLGRYLKLSYRVQSFKVKRVSPYHADDINVFSQPFQCIPLIVYD